MPKSLNPRWIVAASAALALLVGVAIVLGHGIGLDALRMQQAQLEAWQHAHPLTTGLGFFGVFIAAAALSLPATPLLSIAAGAVLGPLWGTMVSSFASALGATLAFLLSRWLLRDWVRRRLGARMAAVDAGVRRDGGWYLLTLRIVPILPGSVINLCFSVTALRAWTFYWISQLGTLLATGLYVNAGTQLAHLTSLADIATPRVLASLTALAVLPLLARYGLTRWRTHAARGDVPETVELTS
jgi:uncharacterized membrane protein YdjX (TVP38/TMEM64 family)